MSKPGVSVIIPAYNAGPWLKEAIDSVRAQTFQDWELIVVNDGSTDNTAQVAREHSDPRIHVIDQVNSGVSAARNTGIAMARGGIIGFLDADDAMLPDNLQQKVDLMLKTGVDWVFGDMIPCDPHLQPKGGVMTGTDGDVKRMLLLNVGTVVPIACSNVLARRHCFEQGVAFDTTLSNSADQDFTLQLAHRFSYRHLSAALGKYRVLPSSMSKNVLRYQEDHLRFFKKVRQQGHLANPNFRRTCMANVYWAIGGTWWRQARKPLKAVPFFFRALALSPAVLARPLLKRFTGCKGTGVSLPKPPEQ